LVSVVAENFLGTKLRLTLKDWCRENETPGASPLLFNYGSIWLESGSDLIGKVSGWYSFSRSSAFAIVRFVHCLNLNKLMIGE
jgi:hypothetical protein